MRSDDTPAADITAAVCARLLAETGNVTPATDAPAIDKNFLLKCLTGNEYGDALLFAKIFRGQFGAIAGTETWLKWDGHHWIIDEFSEARQGCLKVAEAYHGLLAEVGDNDKLVKKIKSRIDRLNSCSGQRRLLEMVSCGIKNPLAVRQSDIDAKPHLIPCKNGVIDLADGGKLKPGRSEDYLLRAIPHEYHADATCPNWLKAIYVIFDRNLRVVNFIQRYFGYTLTGSGKEHRFLVLYGIGRNGKGILVSTFQHVLGEFCRPIASELLLEQRAPRSSAAPSPDLMALKGIRLAVASETDAGRAFSASRVKLLSGGDQITARNPHDKADTIFKPSHNLMLLTNHKPKAPASDTAFWSRCLLLNFPVVFCENPKKPNERPIDRDLAVSLESEAQGILAWLIQGAIQYQKHGLDVPEEVKAATSDYRQAEDVVGQFISECCEIGDGYEARAKPLYQEFCKWYSENVNADRNPITVVKFGEELLTQFKRDRDGYGKFYSGLRINAQMHSCVQEPF